MTEEPVTRAERGRSGSERAGDDPPFTRRHLLVLVAITLLAAALRLYKVGEWSFWIDEAHTFRDMMVDPERFWSSNVRYYPVSYLVVRWLSDLFASRSETWLRLPFVFFGVVSVPMLALVGRAMVGRWPALIAALLLAVSPWHIYWSQNARAYSMVVFFSLLAAGAFYVSVQRRSVLFLGLTLVATAVAGMCHPSAYLLLGAFLAFALYGPLFDRGKAAEHGPLGKWLPLVLLVAVAVVIALLVPLARHFHRVKPDFSLLHLIQTTVFFVRTPLLVAAVGGLLLTFDREERAAPFLLCWSLVPLVVLAVLASGFAKVTAQYAFYTLPAFCLLAGTVVVALARRVPIGGFRSHLLRVVPAGILLLDMGGHDYLYFEKYHGERPLWREAAQFIQRQRGGDKRILTTNAPSLRYYLEPHLINRPWDRAATVEQLEDWRMADGETGLTPHDWMAAQAERARAEDEDLWVVVTEPELYEMDRHGLANTYLRLHLQQVRRYPNWTGPKDMTVLVYRLPR